MKNKVKIALCLSGEPRSSMFSFPYIYESLIDIADYYEVDVYIHSWKYFRALPLYKPKNYQISWINEEKYFDQFLNKLKTNEQILTPDVNKELKYIIQNTPNAAPLKNTLLMYLSMQSCFNLIEESYDVYIKGRFDYYFSNKLDIIHLIKNITEEKNDIIIPTIEHLQVFNEHEKYIRILPDDRFAICNLKGAKYYFNLYNDIDNILLKLKLLNPHFLLKDYLAKSELNITTTNITPMDLVRSSKVITKHHTPYLDN